MNASIPKQDPPKQHAVLIHSPAKRAHGVRLIFGWRRLLCAFVASSAAASLWLPTWTLDLMILYGRYWSTALVCLLAFGVFEQWPKRLPRGVARWVLQVGSVALVIPICMFGHYMVGADPGVPFWHNIERVQGYIALTMSSLLVAPWVAMSALIRKSEAFVQTQAVAFELERSELARQASDARLQLLQAQVAPHFLFNTLANVQALVRAGSPRAEALLGSLIAYLRAAVPRLQDGVSSLGEEQKLARAYLELMHMRIPDRLSFELRLDPATLALRCPPMTLITLVENAIKHGIDPSEDGGHIEVVSELCSGTLCKVSVRNTGAGLIGCSQTAPLARTPGLSSGLSSLRERLQLAFGSAASLQLGEDARGVVAELMLPAQSMRA